MKFFAFLMMCVIYLYADKPTLELANNYHHDANVTGWLMSEKLDGVRGYWDGKRLLTKKGHPIAAPSWFTSNFPKFPLDGELWSKRGDFSHIQSVVLDDVPSEQWRKISYHIFEAPQSSGDFQARLQHARAWFLAHPAPHVKIISQTICKNSAHLANYLKVVESKGGEGVMIKDPKSSYGIGRSSHILKVKRFEDMEGEVIVINAGEGKYIGMMGSLTVRLANGIVFRLGGGFSDHDRLNPPCVGDLVTFRYTGLTKNGKPKFASFMRIRNRKS